MSIINRGHTKRVDEFAWGLRFALDPSTHAILITFDVETLVPVKVYKPTLEVRISYECVITSF
jgi:hypothetical protein